MKIIIILVGIKARHVTYLIDVMLFGWFKNINLIMIFFKMITMNLNKGRIRVDFFFFAPQYEKFAKICPIYSQTIQKKSVALNKICMKTTCDLHWGNKKKKSKYVATKRDLALCIN